VIDEGREIRLVDSTVINWIDGVSIIASIASLIIALVAIWLSKHFKKEADAINKDTQNTLIDIKTDAKSLSAVSGIMMKELEAYGVASRNVMTSNTMPPASDPAPVFKYDQNSTDS